MDIQLDDSRYGYSKMSSQRQIIHQVLKTIANMYKDDFMSAVAALTMCTEELIEQLRIVNFTINLKPKSNLRLCGSLAGGFTPRLSE